MKYRARPIEVQAYEIEAVRAAGTEAAPGHMAEMILVGFGRFLADGRMTTRHWPQPGDYLVLAPQPDGSVYPYLNPRDVFESKYEMVDMAIQISVDEDTENEAEQEGNASGEQSPPVAESATESPQAEPEPT